MAVTYRVVKANESNDVIAIGYDEAQGNADYNGVGVWCDFTFDEIPTVPAETQTWIDENEYKGNVLTVDGLLVDVKSLETLQAE